MRLWLAWRYLNSGGRFQNASALLAILGLVIGVAALVVSMAVVSGYERTLRRAVIDVVGHVVVVKRGKSIEGEKEINEVIKPLITGYVAHTPFVVVEGVIAHKKNISGVVLEGADPESLHEVLNLKSRLVDGNFSLDYIDDLPEALIGKEIAKKFDLKVGDHFRVIRPQSTGYNSDKFRPRPQKFVVSGILNLGRYDYDSRFVLTSINAAQDFAERGSRITGLRFKVEEDQMAVDVAKKIRADDTSPYWARSWYGASKNIFEAYQYEKPVIFLVIIIILVAAGFNVTSTLLVGVMKRYRDISILKTIGAKRGFLLRMIALQGVLIGLLGSALGLALGYVLCLVFSWAQEEFQLIPGEVYKIEKIEVSMQAMDLTIIIGAAILICLIAALAPALKGARMKTIEGLRYE